MTDLTTRWCVHIPGPDDLYAQASKEDAERLAREHNEWVEKHCAHWFENPAYPCRESVTAQVIPWPHGPVTDAEWAAMVAEDKEEAA